MTIQLQDMKREKEAHEDLWCTRCRINGHTKDEFPAYMNYVSSGGPSPMNSQGLPWCNIFQIRGHQETDCLFMHKTICTPTSLYCKFWKYVGHDEKDCRSYQLMREKMVDAYIMKTEEKIKIKEVVPQF